MNSNLETIRNLVSMLHEAQTRAAQIQSEYEHVKAARDRWTDLASDATKKVKELRAQIAELQARPAAPSVEAVADALVAMHEGSTSPDEALADIFPDLSCDASGPMKAAFERYFENEKRFFYGEDAS